MQNQIKLPIYAALLMLAVIFAVTVKSCFTKTPVFSNIERIREIRDDSISYWKDAYGREHAEKQIAQADLATIKVVYGPLIDSVLKSLDIQGKQLENLAVVGLSNSGHLALKVDTVFIDSTTKNYRFHYSDKWIQLAGLIGNNSFLDYTTYDSLIISGYYKKSGFLGLGKRTSYIDAYSINPHSKITGLQGIQIYTEKPKRFGIGPYLGYGWNGTQWAPNIGIGLNYSLLRF